MAKMWGKAVSFVTGEWILTKRGYPNGGAVVTARSAWTALLVYAGAVLAREFVLTMASGIGPDPSWKRFWVVLSETGSWLGVFFGAAFTFFYTRFAQQWTYLANLYNQIKAVEVRSAGVEAAVEPLDQWRAGFIEDAVLLHLAAKPQFLTVIHNWYGRPAVEHDVREHSTIMERLQTILDANPIESPQIKEVEADVYEERDETS